MLKTTNHPNRLLIFSRPCRLTSISLEDEFQENICFIDYAKAFDCVKSYDKPRQRIKKERHHFANKGSHSECYGFSSSHVWLWESDHKEGWVLKNWCFWIVVLEKTLESPLDRKEIKPVNPKGNQPWIFIGRDWCWSSNTSATWWEELTHWKKCWCWERLKAGGEGGSRGWDG